MSIAKFELRGVNVDSDYVGVLVRVFLDQFTTDQNAIKTLMVAGFYVLPDCSRATPARLYTQILVDIHGPQRMNSDTLLSHCNFLVNNRSLHWSFVIFNM